MFSDSVFDAEIDLGKINEQIGSFVDTILKILKINVIVNIELIYLKIEMMNIGKKIYKHFLNCVMKKYMINQLIIQISKLT